MEKDKTKTKKELNEFFKLKEDVEKKIEELAMKLYCTDVLTRLEARTTCDRLIEKLENIREKL